MMRIQTLLQGGLAAAVMVAAGGCGDDKSETTGFSGGYGTYPTPTNPSAPVTTDDTSSVGSEGTDSSTNPVDPPTTSTGVDPTTTTAPPMTSTTTDPSTTSTTTTMPMTMPMTTDDTSTSSSSSSSSTTDDTSSSSTTTTTTMGMTTDPPAKDPQPAAGLFSNCWPSEMCTGADGCLTLQDANMVKFDGFCTDLCVTAADCIPKPNGPAIARCLAISVDQTACFLECVTEADCPTGMTCELVGLPNGDGSYCW